MLLSSFTLVFAADTVTLNDQVSISNIIREETPMYLKGVPVYVCQAPVTVTLLKDSTAYTVADIVIDDEDGFFPSVGYLHGNGEAKPSAICTSRIYKDGTEVILKAYNIGGNNYFKLRDLGQAFDFDVSWNGEENCITVETAKSYTPD